MTKFKDKKRITIFVDPELDEKVKEMRWELKEGSVNRVYEMLLEKAIKIVK